jgi:Uma2 family endonuclease
MAFDTLQRRDYAQFMLQAIPPLINRQDYEAMREGPPYYQLVEGDLIMSPSPTSFHQTILGNLFFLVRHFLSENPLGRVFLAPLDVFLNDINIYQPDIVFVARKHLGRITDRGIEGAPDLVVEILSPSTSVYDRGSKRKVYAKSRVKEMWLIDPDKKRIQVFHLQQNAEAPAVNVGPRGKLTSRTFPGLALECAALFKK